MPAPADHGIQEISTARPRLRADLRTHYQQHRGKPSYIVEDPAGGRYFHIGQPEHQFIQSLDGRTTVSRALARNAASQGEEALTEQQGHQLVRWLIDNGLLETATSGQAERRRDHRDDQKGRQQKKWISKLLFFKMPLGCPERPLARLSPFCGWIFSLPGLILWLGLMAFAGFELGQHWNPFIEASRNIVAPGNWLPMVLVYVCLKLIHEIGHGIATQRFGGTVSECGVQMLVFVTPLTYADVSSSWRFPSRWHRITVAAAGMFVELAVAAICLILWTRTEPGLLNTTLHNAVFTASMVTVFFNANPLMRFDGYHILVELLGIPNLGSKGQQFLMWAAKRGLLGMRDLPFPPTVRPHLFWIPLYGILAALWRIVIMVGILSILSLMFRGAGMALALVIIASGLIGILGKLVKYLATGGPGGARPDLRRAIPRIAFFTGIVTLALYLIRIDPASRAVAVVEFADKEVVRAGCSGQVEAVYVEDGQQVEPGHILARLSNPNEEIRRDQLKLEVAQAKIRALRHLQEGDLSAHQAEGENLAGLEKRLAETEAYLAFLTVTAPIAGQVTGRRLDSLPGQWIEPGREILLSLAPGQEKELLLSIRQKDIEHLRARADERIVCRLRGRSGEIEGRLEQVESRATRALPHPALSSANGGPLGVRGRVEPLAERERDITRNQSGYAEELDHFRHLDEREAHSELVQARLAARARLTASVSRDLMEGEWGYARLSKQNSERLGTWLFQRSVGYVRNRLEQQKAARGFF